MNLPEGSPHSYQEKPWCSSISWESSRDAETDIQRCQGCHSSGAPFVVPDDILSQMGTDECPQWLENRSLLDHDTYSTAWWYTYPFEKYESQLGWLFPIYQWEFQDPKMEVLYHIRPYVVGIFPYIGLTKALYMVDTSNLGSWNGHWIYGKIKAMFQTTNQSMYIYSMEP